MMEGIYKEMHDKGYRLIRGAWATPDELEAEVKKLDAQVEEQKGEIALLKKRLDGEELNANEK